MNRLHLFSFLAGMLGFLLSSTAVSGRELSLEAAMQLAREHSFVLKQAKAEEEASQAALSAAQASRLPTLSATATAFHNTNVASFSMELPGVTLSRQIGTKDHYQTDLRLSLPLFTGGRISGGIDAAAAGRDYREALVNASVEQLELASRVAYLRLVQATDLVGSATSALKRTQVIQDDIQSMYDAGVADSTDLLESQLALTSAQFALDDARTSRRSAEINLLNLLGLPPEDTLNPTTTLPDPSEPKRSVTVGQPGQTATGGCECRGDALGQQNEVDKGGLLPHGGLVWRIFLWEA